jgi:hypothetical protein
MILKKSKSILIILVFIMSISILGYNLKSVYSIENGNEQEYEQYVLTWIDEFVKIQEENPLIFSIETKYLDENREAIQLRNRVINNFQYEETRVPEKYKDVHKELLQILTVYKDAYDNLYIGITTGDSRLVGENVGKLYESDIVLDRIRNTLST